MLKNTLNALIPLTTIYLIFFKANKLTTTLLFLIEDGFQPKTVLPRIISDPLPRELDGLAIIVEPSILSINGFASNPLKLSPLTVGS